MFGMQALLPTCSVASEPVCRSASAKVALQVSKGWGTLAHFRYAMLQAWFLNNVFKDGAGPRRLEFLGRACKCYTA